MIGAILLGLGIGCLIVAILEDLNRTPPYSRNKLRDIE